MIIVTESQRAKDISSTQAFHSFVLEPGQELRRSAGQDMTEGALVQKVGIHQGTVEVHQKMHFMTQAQHGLDEYAQQIVHPPPQPP